MPITNFQIGASLCCGDRSITGQSKMDNIEVLREKLDKLRMEHRDLDGVIVEMQSARGSDQLQLARLKKRKLEIKTQIASLESKLIPDITA